MDEVLAGFIMFTLIFLGVFIGHKIGNNPEAKKAIRICEAKLPRNQNCKLIAVIDDTRAGNDDPSTDD